MSEGISSVLRKDRPFHRVSYENQGESLFNIEGTIKEEKLIMTLVSDGTS